MNIMTKQEIEDEEAFKGLSPDNNPNMFTPVKNLSGTVIHYILSKQAISRIKKHHQPKKDDVTIEVITKSLDITRLLTKVSIGKHTTSYNM
jgi:hypothetical protein